MTGKLVGYARVSTDSQNAGLEEQIRDLTAAHCDIIYNEEVSSVADRPEFAAALAELQPGDIVIRDGAPVQAAPAPAGHFLDRAL